MAVNTAFPFRAMVSPVEFDFTVDASDDSFDGEFGLFGGEDASRNDILPGSYTFTEGTESGWTLNSIECSAEGGSTFSTTSSSVTITFEEGDDVQCTFNNNIVNPDLGSIHGIKYDWDTENRLPGWTIELYQGEELIDTAVTMEDDEQTDENELGMYWFENLEDGTYTVCEVLQEGWTQILPDTEDGCHEVEIVEEVKKLVKKYKKDPKRVQVEMMQLYKEHKVNPFGGCLPLIIQMPFLFAMFNVLKSTFSLRGASFIPGWIDNLTAPDILFSWSYPIPFIGTHFHLLPILLGVVMFFQQKLSTSQNKNKAVLTDQQKQQQKMGSIMTIVFTVLFYKFPSGLNIYWLSSMSLAILQQLWAAKRMQKKMASPTEVVVTPKKKN